AVGQLGNVINGSFLLVLGDIYYAPKNLDLMVKQFEAQGGGAVLAVMREPDLEAMKKNFTVEQGEDGMVRRVVEKPRNPINDLKGCGIYMFGDEMFDAIRKTPRTALRDEYEITNSIQILCDDGYPVSVAEVVEWDCNITFARDLLNANVQYLERHNMDNLVHPTAEVHKDAVLERVVVGEGAKILLPVHIRNAVILPDTVVDRGSRIEEMIISKEEWHQC
ncbi:MAG: glucose-1-phosphate thymidylyltransferase, partial [Planctomycetota bacterium]